MNRVLFVCLGNICRSPMAEALFREKVKKAGLQDQFEIDSAGTGDWHIGKAPHVGTQKILKKAEISCDGMAARQVTAEDFSEFDYIIAMDEQNAKDLQRLASSAGVAPENIEKVTMMLSYLPNPNSLNVPDPYYTGNFEEVYEMLNRSCELLLTKIIHP